jgi:hypothetical protein
MAHIFRPYCRLLAAGLMLGSCERKPATTTVQVATPTQPVRSSTALQTSPGRTQIPADTLASPDSTAADNPQLHQPFEDTKVLAPGLAVVIASVPVPATAIIREPSDLRLAFSIKYGGRVIFRDTANDGLTYTYFSMPQTEKLYPLWLPTGRGSGELLVAFNNRPSKELARRFFIKDFRVAKIDTLLTFSGPATDVDKDGKLEYAGFYDFGETWQDEKGRNRQLYIPTLYYEVRPSGLVLDSALTKQKTKAQFGAFYGYKYSDKPIIYAK